ncbi:MAG: hypothetical protein ACYC2T_03160 [Bacillota bacterium]
MILLLNLLAPMVYTGQADANRGYLDLSHWNFDQNGPDSLDGQWEFYWGKLLTPADFNNNKVNINLPRFLKVPSPWNASAGTKDLTDKGVGTYRLRVRLNSTNMMYGIKTANIRMSNKIFIDGIEVGNSGNPGISGDAYVMANTPCISFFTPNENEIEIIVQVADFDYKAGGIIQSIYLGNRADILTMAGRLNFFDIFLAACLFVTGVYYICVFLGRRKEQSLLY